MLHIRKKLQVGAADQLHTVGDGLEHLFKGLCDAGRLAREVDDQGSPTDASCLAGEHYWDTRVMVKKVKKQSHLKQEIFAWKMA